MEHEFIGAVMLLIFLVVMTWIIWKDSRFRREVVYPMLGVLLIGAYIGTALTLLGF